MNFVYFRQPLFFLQNEIIYRGKKHAGLFQTYNWEKSSFFNALVRVFAETTDILKYVAGGGIYGPLPSGK